MVREEVVLRRELAAADGARHEPGLARALAGLAALLTALGRDAEAARVRAEAASRAAGSERGPAGSLRPSGAWCKCAGSGQLDTMTAMHARGDELAGCRELAGEPQIGYPTVADILSLPVIRAGRPTWWPAPPARVAASAGCMSPRWPTSRTCCRAASWC